MNTKFLFIFFFVLNFMTGLPVAQAAISCRKISIFNTVSDLKIDAFETVLTIGKLTAPQGSTKYDEEAVSIYPDLAPQQELWTNINFANYSTSAEIARGLSKNTLIDATMGNLRRQLSDQQAARKTIAFNFFSSGNGKSLQAKMLIETTLTQDLSKKQNRAIRFEADFEVPEEIDWVNIRLSDFKLVGVSSKDQKTLLTEGQQILRLGFQILETEGKEVLLGREIGLATEMRSEDTSDIIDSLKIEPQSNFLKYESHKANKIIRVKKVLKKFFLSMQQLENQKWAVSIVKQGLATINKELAAYGWHTNTAFEEKVHLAQVITQLAGHDLFYEAGDFGEHHGPFAHQAQFLAGMKGLTKSEVENLSDFVANYIGDIEGGGQWAIWNLLVDTRGNTIHGNRFWRDLINKN